MNKQIDLPAPSLSALKKVHLTMDMTGKHYELLAAYEGGSPEQVILSILTDLMEEDANKLTREEANYLFTLVRIASLGDDIPMNITCPHCKHEGKATAKLSATDLKTTPILYKIPTVEWVCERGKEPETFQIVPPPLAMEVSLFDWFLTTQDKTRQQLLSEKPLLMMFSMLKALLHLTRRDGTRFIETTDDFQMAHETLSFNPYRTTAQLDTYQTEVDSFGMKPNRHTYRCKECGGTSTFHLPLLYGLYNQGGDK